MTQICLGHSDRLRGVRLHLDTVLGTQRDKRNRLNRLPCGDRETIALRNRGKHQARFHQGKLVADADTRTAAKREVGILRNALLKITFPALRREAFRFGEVALAAMRSIRGKQYTA